MQPSLREALKVQRCSEEDMDVVWSALKAVGLTSPDDWSTDFIQEADLRGYGLSLLLSRKVLAALKTAGGAQASGGFRLLPPDKNQPAPSASYGVSPDSPVVVPTQEAQPRERNNMGEEQFAST